MIRRNPPHPRRRPPKTEFEEPNQPSRHLHRRVPLHSARASKERSGRGVLPQSNTRNCLDTASSATAVISVVIIRGNRIRETSRAPRVPINGESSILESVTWLVKDRGARPSLVLLSAGRVAQSRVAIQPLTVSRRYKNVIIKSEQRIEREREGGRKTEIGEYNDG